MREAFFSIVDRNNNGTLSYEEWIGTFTKSIDPKNIELIDWFVDQFSKYTSISGNSVITKEDFIDILSDNEFGFRLSLLISNKGKKIKAIQLMSTIEIMASLSMDGKWLSWLKYQFTNAMRSHRNDSNKSDDDKNPIEMKISLNDFINNFHFKEPFLAHRLFNYLDQNNSGYLTMFEFINGLEIVVNGNRTDKMRFLFKVFDMNSDGRIDFEEMKMLLKCCMDDTPYVNIDDTMEELAAYLFTKTDKDDSGDISFEELQEAFQQYDSIFSQLTFSTSIWIKPKFIKQQKRGILSKTRHRFISYLNNQRTVIIFWFLYTLIHLACSLNALIKYFDSSIWIIIARFFGASLNFNCALMLVLVLRKHLTLLRTKGAHKVLPLDQLIDIHKLVGFIILTEGLIHTVAHLINLYFLCRIEYMNFLTVLFTGKVNIGYPTGVILSVIFLIIFIFAMPFVRRSGYFQVFYWAHMLTIPWLLIMLFHGKSFWIWLLIPFVLYVIENIQRYRKISSHKFGETFIEESYVLPSKVTHLVIKKPPKFRFNPGDYIFVNIPTIAKYEWHPFSISSAPENSEYLWLHIRAAGNWTNKLLDYSMSTRFDTSLTSANRSRQSNPGYVMRTTLMQPNKVDYAKVDKNSNNHDTNHKVNFQTEVEMLSFPKSTQKNKENNYIKKSILKKSVENKHYYIHTADSTIYKSIDDQTFDNTNSVSKVITETQDVNKTINKTPEVSGHDKENIDIESKVKMNGVSVPTVESTPKVSALDEARININDEIEPKRVNMSLSHIKASINEVDDEGSSLQRLDTSLASQKNFLKDELKNDLSVIVDLESDRTTENNSRLVSDDEFGIETISKTDSIIRTSKNGSYFLNKVKAMTSFEMIKFRNNSHEKNLVHTYTQNASLENKEETDKSSDDILGYNKMYKGAKVKIETIGLDNLWRLRILIDGPYGAPSSSIFDSQHALLVGAGIGITPFASILQSLMSRYKKTKVKCPNCKSNLNVSPCFEHDMMELRKVDFIWVTREQRSLEWFISILSKIEIDQRKNNAKKEEEGSQCEQNMFMESHLYVTSAKRQSDLKSISLHLTLDALYSKEDSHLIDGLKKRTHYGRPNWDMIMQNLIRQQNGKIDVFYCGPTALANVLSKKCSEYDFKFKREIF